MKVAKVERISCSDPIPVYDVVDVQPHHNFIVHSNSDMVVHNCGMMDEMNFARAGVKDITKAKEHMKDLYNTVSARVKGTFRQGGEVYGKLFAVSSKRSDSDFMEIYMQNQMNAGAGDHMYVSDAPQWEVLPPDMFQKKTFTIAVGDRYHKGFVVDDESDKALEELTNSGYTLLHPPIDMRSDFVADFDIALRDLAGISVLGALSYITQDAITPCINAKRKNPFYQEILEIGTRDPYTIEEYFHMELVDPSLKHCPLFVHLDLSLSDDKTGIGGCAITGRKDIVNESGKTISMPFFTHIFSVDIKAPRGDKIPFAKITAFICWLRQQGFNIGKGVNSGHVSRDQFQSEYLGQLLEAQQFDVDKLSLDRTPDGYAALRSVLLEQRVDMLDVKLLQDELIRLQRDGLTGKIDHPIGGCFTGDTRIRLVDGRTLTIEELLVEQTYRTNWVYTVNLDSCKIEPKRILNVFQTKLVSVLVRITLDNGQQILCTPEHRFMLRNGEYVEASVLTPGTSLMPLYTKISEKGLAGYRLYYDPFSNQWHYEHRSFCTDTNSGTVIHHCNYNKLDNCPSNLKRMNRSQHRSIHNNETQDYVKVSKSIRKWYQTISGTDIEQQRNNRCRAGAIASLKASGRYRNNDQLRQDRIAAIESRYGVIWEQLSDADKNRYGVLYTRELDPNIQHRISASLRIQHASGRFDRAHAAIAGRIWYTDGETNLYIKQNESPPPGFRRGRTISESVKQHMQISRANMSTEMREHIREALSKDTSNRIWITDGTVDKYIRSDIPIPQGFRRGRTANIKNHKVVSIEYIHKPCKVYDLTIEDNPNFALDAGVFVHNSKDMSDGFAGAIWNATLVNPGLAVPARSVASAIAAVNGRKSGFTGSSHGSFNNNSIYRGKR